MTAEEVSFLKRDPRAGRISVESLFFVKYCVDQPSRSAASGWVERKPDSVPLRIQRDHERSFQIRNEYFFARSRKTKDGAEAYREYAAQGILQFDAEIAEKDHF